MENNIVDIENEYFKKKNKEAYELLINKEFEKVVDILKEPIEKINKKLEEDKKYCPQNIFEATIFMNFLQPKLKQEDFAKINYYDFYLMNAAANYNLENFEESRKSYEKAIELNPASAIAKLQVLEMDKKEKRFDCFIDDVKNVFDFAYRRADMARAYRNVGYYLYEQKDYEMAIVAYYLSNIYQMTELSMQEVNHIAEVANIDLNEKQWLSEEMMGDFYEKYKIPLLPNQNLAKLAIIMADDAYEKKAYKAAQFTYGVAYELTLEDEYLKKIEELKNLNS